MTNEHGRVLLVPTSFDARSEHALGVALDLGRALDARTVVVHVCAIASHVYPIGEFVVFDDHEGELVREARRCLEQLAQAHPGVTTILRKGIPSTELLRVIDQIEPIMVVMGTHGRTGLRRVLLGSVTEQVIRRSSCPVLTVRERASEHRARAA